MRPLLHPQRTLLSLSLSTLAASMTTSTSPPHTNTTNTTIPPTWPTRPYTRSHQTWPYRPTDFHRADPSPDTDFYSTPRFVTHIDNPAISLLKTYYTHTLPRTGRILDFCSSWISHFPPELESAVLTKKELEVVGMGINDAELAANRVLSTRILQDLNEQPLIPAEQVGTVHAATCVVSIDYLTSPVAVLASLRERMVKGGRVHLVVSNRCFPTKAVQRWLRVGEEEKLEMVGDYLWFAGWREVEIVTLNDGGGSGGGWFGFGRTDPLWVVRGTNTGEQIERGTGA
ncbi:MAG: hypothetical protein M1830_001382 [Pleopsidium flavum]|nr:MAG: hypothetical protein M1830_001382 [Pleopsidium flavum]